MLPTIDTRSFTKDGTVLGSALLRASEYGEVVDVRTAAAGLRRRGDSIAIAARAGASEGVTEGTRLAIEKIVAEYARVHSNLQTSTEAVGKALLAHTINVLEVTLTPEQTASVLAKLLLSELPDDIVPKLAIRVSPSVELYFRVWLSENAPPHLVEHIQIFANDNVPATHMLVRADESLTDHALSQAITAAAASAVIKMDIQADKQLSSEVDDGYAI
jgi:hypothetical protein